MRKVRRAVVGRSAGFVAEGSHYYVWDEDREVLERLAAELASAERLVRTRRGGGRDDDLSMRGIASPRKAGKPAQR